ncbi:MAG: hypothetical protein Q7R95_10860 [bacterium]|nr:hypothetical protein [bacterium]
MFDINKCEKIILPQGAIYLGSSDEKKSVGYLELNPHTSLNIHNRPAIENLTQIKGKSNMVIYNENKSETFLLHQGSKLKIKPEKWHIHVNPYNEVSLTYWDFDGDIRKIIDNVRKSAKE